MEKYGTPYELIQDKASILSHLMSNLETSERERLSEIAKACWQTKHTVTLSSQ